MKNQTKFECRLSFCCLLAVGFLLSACSKQDGAIQASSQSTAQANLSGANFNSFATYTSLLSVNYDNGLLNSGIPNLEVTDATAPDAAYMVSPGRSGTYAIAHKVVLGDSSYFSDEHWRSESATNAVAAGKFVPGDERRYEFSVLLKDWTPYTTGMPASGDIIFQAKLGGGGNPAWYFMTKRNAIAFRDPNANLQTNIVADYRPYINQWMDFRVDVLWANTATGYMKVYSKLPGQTDYTLIWQISNFQTWNPDNPNAVTGYMKWGLYRPDESVANGDVLTRVIYHDSIKIYNIQP